MYIKKIEQIKKNWAWMNNKVIYAQLLERLVDTHNIEIEEATDILSVAYAIIKDETRRGYPGPAMG